MIGPTWLTTRRLVAVVVVGLALPTLVAGVEHEASAMGAAEDGPAGPSVENLTIVASQGRSPDVTASPGGLEIVNTTSKRQVWNHGRQRCMRYYDADPIDQSTLLFSANCRADDGGRVRLAFEYDWRDDAVERVFQIPFDNHDLDKLGPDTYAVADIQNQRAYVYDYAADEAEGGPTYRDHAIPDARDGPVEWEFDFTERYPETDGGEEGYDGDFTHLNDVDPVDGGSAFLLSPRDFNRVVLVDRASGSVEWTLGAQDRPGVIRGQHHPALLEADPPTVLVGDSLNHRVVEYRRVDGEWELSWYYRGDLNWPRAVGRLPNGNTLVMDTGNDRALEVTPTREVVWEYETTYPNPYDVVRYAHGDEGGGPPMHEVREDAGRTPAVGDGGGPSLLDEYHRVAGFVLPGWVGELEFAGLVGAAAVLVGWVFGEAGLAARRRR